MITSRRESSERGRRVPQPVDVVVPRRVLLDVEVGLRDVRLRLVVVVVGDEVLDGVRREELAELVAELRGERLVVRDHERRPADLLDRPRHRRRLAGARRADERLEALAGQEALGERLDRARLVAGRAVPLGCFQRSHETQGIGMVVLDEARATPSSACSRLVLQPEPVRVRAPVDALQPLDTGDVCARLRELDRLVLRAPAVDVLLPGVVRGERGPLVAVLVEQMAEVPGAVADVDLGLVEVRRRRTSSRRCGSRSPSPSPAASCMRPIAPVRDFASALNLLSCSITAASSAASRW